MVKFTWIHIALLVLITIVIIYLIFKANKNDHKPIEDKYEEGTFEKLLRTMKSVSKLSIYNNNVLSFPSEDTNKIINEWVKNFVKDYCNKDISLNLPSDYTPQLEKVINFGMAYTILNSDKSLNRKKDDIAIFTFIFPLFLFPVETELPFKILDENTVEIIGQSKVSFKELKNDIYNSIMDLYTDNNEGKQRFLKKSKETDKVSTDEDIYKAYNELNNQYKNSAKVYCQNI